MSSTSILKFIEHYQRSIEQCPDDEGRLLHCISKLYHLPVKVEHLQETGVGKTVNSLRKYNGEIGVAAKALVTKWKAMVAAEEEPVEANCPANEDETNAINERKSSDDEHHDHRDHRRNNEHKKSEEKHSTRPSSKDKDKHKNKYDKDNGVSTTKETYGNDAHHHEKSKPSTQKTAPSHTSNHHSEKKDTERHHKSREKDDKTEHKERSKDRQGKHENSRDRSEKIKEESKEDRHRGREEKKSTASSHHRSSSSKKKEEKSHEGSRHHTSREKSNHTQEKESKHRKIENHSSSRDKDKEEADFKKTKHENQNGVKLSRNEKEHRDKNKTSGNVDFLSNEPSTSAAALAAATSSHSTSSSASKRKHCDISELDSGDMKVPKPKATKVKKTSEDNHSDNDGFDSSMGTNFADVLGMLSKPIKKTKRGVSTSKGSTPSSVSTYSGGSSKDSPTKTISSFKMNGEKSYASSITAPSSNRSPDAKPDLLSCSTKLEPLDPSIAFALPIISNNYKPMPLNQTVMDCVFNTSLSAASKAQAARALSDAEALCQSISSKTMRTKIYSGFKSGQILQVPTLFDLCIRVLQKNIDALEYTGGVPFEVLRPVLERATPHQLLIFEEYNPYLMEDSDVLWQLHVQRSYRVQKRQELETWREMFLRCQEDQERKLNILAESIKQSQKITAAPVRKTQLAYVDSMVKPPRNVQRKQEQYGTKAKLIATPASRVAALSSVTPNAAKTGDMRLRVSPTVRDTAQVSSSAVRPKKAPLMVKTLQFMRGRHKR